MPAQFFNVISFAIICLFFNSLHAQEQIEQTVSAYPASYFEAFKVRTALDMVTRIPGYSINNGDNDKRGFGQAKANFLINGKRPSSKSSNAQETLQRILASSVERIEILDGATLSISGLSGQIANIITQQKGLTGRWQYSAYFEQGTEPQIDEFEVSLSGNHNKLEYSLNLKHDPHTSTADGTEQFFDNNGQLTDDREEHVFFKLKKPEVDLSLSYTADSGRQLNVNFSGSKLRRSSGNDELFNAVTPAGTSGTSLFRGGENETEFELGGDYNLPLKIGSANGNLKIIGLHRSESSLFTDSFLFQENGEDDYLSNYTDDQKEGESIIRPEFSFTRESGTSWQLSLEATRNFLKSDSLFEETDELAEIENVKVVEIRSEIAASYNKSFSNSVSIQGLLAAEYSKLSVPSHTDPARKFFRPKGFVAMSWTMSPIYKVNAKIERKVGQLNFRNFISSVSLSDGNARQGNVNIVPNQAWQTDIELEYNNAELFSGKAKVYFNLIEDPIEAILFEDGSEGFGNLESAEEIGVAFNGTWLMDYVGFKGGRFEFELGGQYSQIDDNITGMQRQISGNSNYYYELKVSQDIANSNWGWEINGNNFDREPNFQIDETIQVHFSKPWAQLLLNYKDFYGFRFDLSVGNFLDSSRVRERYIYDTTRVGELEEYQIYKRKRGLRYSLNVSRSF